MIVNGGWCAPSEELYALARQPRHEIPTVQVRRGGIRYDEPPLVMHGPPEPGLTISMHETVRRERHWTLRELAELLGCQPSKVEGELRSAEIHAAELDTYAEGDLLRDLYDEDEAIVHVVTRAWGVRRQPPTGWEK